MNREGQKGTEYHLDSLYQKVIMVHANNPAGTTNLQNETVRIEGYNPLCGDELTICLDAAPGIRDEDLIGKAQILVMGCSICRASGSLLWNLMQEKSLAEIKSMVSHFREVLSGRLPNEQILGEASALQGVARFPVRIDCALLPWSHLEEAIEKVQSHTHN